MWCQETVWIPGKENSAVIGNVKIERQNLFQSTFSYFCIKNVIKSKESYICMAQFECLEQTKLKFVLFELRALVAVSPTYLTNYDKSCIVFEIYNMFLLSTNACQLNICWVLFPFVDFVSDVESLRRGQCRGQHRLGNSPHLHMWEQLWYRRRIRGRVYLETGLFKWEPVSELNVD